MASSSSAVSRRLRHPVLFFLSILLAPALWILFVASGKIHELLVGAIASLATVLFTLFVCRSSGEELVLRPCDVIQIWRLPWCIARGVSQITLVAFKDLLGVKPAESLYRVCGFDTTTHDPVRRARTVMAIAYTTASPNFIVIGVDPAQSRMIFHQIESSTISKMTKALGAKS
jgi:multisubunit Na+/H+ antiporter MnhE subunit